MPRINDEGYVEKITSPQLDKTLFRPIYQGHASKIGYIVMNTITIPPEKVGKRCRFKVEWLDEDG